MAHGIGEDPHESVWTYVHDADYPSTREELVDGAELDEAPAAVVNFLKSLPQDRYENALSVERDFAEAARRMALGQRADQLGPDRRNIGRDLIEGPSARGVHHP